MSLDRVKKEYKKRNKLNKMFPIHQEPMKERKEYDIDDYYKSFIKLRDISTHLSSELQNSINIQEYLFKETIINEIVAELIERNIEKFAFIDGGKKRRVIEINNLYLLSLFSIELLYSVYQQLLNQSEV